MVGPGPPACDDQSRCSGSWVCKGGWKSKRLFQADIAEVRCEFICPGGQHQCTGLRKSALECALRRRFIHFERTGRLTTRPGSTAAFFRGWRLGRRRAGRCLCKRLALTSQCHMSSRHCGGGQCGQMPLKLFDALFKRFDLFFASREPGAQGVVRIFSCRAGCNREPDRP